MLNLYLLESSKVQPKIGGVTEVNSVSLLLIIKTKRYLGQGVGITLPIAS